MQKYFSSVKHGILLYAVTSQLDWCPQTGVGGGLEVAGLAASIKLATLPTLNVHDPSVLEYYIQVTLLTTIQE